MPYRLNPFTGNLDAVPPSGGDVTGPSGAVDDSIPSFDGSSGKLLKQSALSVSPSGDLTGINTILIPNLGLLVNMPGPGTYQLTIAPGSILTDDRRLRIYTGDEDRDVLFEGDFTVTDEMTLSATPGSIVNFGDGGTVLYSAAPTGASYVTLATNFTLTSERVLTGTSNQVTITDNGAGSTVVLSTPQDIATSSTVQFGRIGIGAAAATGVTADLTQAAASSGTPRAFRITAGTHTALTASTEANDVLLSLARTVQFSTGGIANQRAVYVTAPTYAFVGASTITTAATFAVSGPPVAGTNATLTKTYSILSESGNICFLSGGNSQIIVDFVGTSGNGANKVVRFTSGLTAGSGSTGYVFDSSATRTAGALLEIQSNNASRVTFPYQGGMTVNQLAATTGAVQMFDLLNANHTGQTASTEINNFSMRAYTRTWAAGAITTQRENLFAQPTYAFASASTITNAGNLVVAGAPIAGTNATITNSYALWVQAGVSRFESKLSFDATMTAGGTTGAQTINKPTGSVNFAAGATTLVVTNNLVTTSSIVLVQQNTNDATATVKDVEIASGSFTIRLLAAATAETKVSFIVFN